MAWRDQGSLTKLVLMVGLVVLVCVTFGVRACPPGCTCTRKKAPGSGSGGDNPGDSLVDDADPSGDSGNGVPGHQGAPLSPASISSRGKKIDCSNNPARFTDLSQIEPNILPLDTIQLDLSNNALTAIPTAAFDDLSMLRKLDLSDNEIGLLEPGAFQGLGNLERLDLSSNKIGSINASMFMGMPKLEKLYLSKNRLNTIPEGTFNPLPALKRIDFQSEYLRCDCHLQWMVQWIRDRDVRIRASTICAVPREVTGKPFKQLKKKDLHCEHELQLPLFEVSPSTSQVVFQGDKLPFECRASVIDPATRMIWLRRGKEVYTNRTLGIFVHTATSPDRTVMTHSLVLESLERQHNGIWQCRVSTPQGNVSNSVTITVISDNAMSCPEVTVRTNKGVYIWERTVAGIQKQQPCKVGQKRAPATYYCNNMGNWEHLNVKQCDFISETTRKLQTCAEWDFDDEGSVTQLAQQFLPQSRALRDSVDVVFASNCISRITQFVQHVPALSDPILNAIDSVMKVDKTLLAKAQREDKACSRLVGIVEWLARQLLTTPAHNALSENIAIEARNMSVTPFRGIACTTGLRRDHVIEDLSDGLDELTCMESMNETLFARAAAEITEDDPDIDPYVTPFNMTDFDQDVDAAILLPRTLVQKVPVLKGVSMGKVGVTIIVYSDAAFFPVTAGTHDDPVLQGSEWQPVSPVISASIGQSVANLTDPVIGLLKVSDPSRRLVAAYWDFDANGGLGDWRTEGCRITEQHGNVSVFHCYHLTNFVILQNLSSLLVGVFIMMEPVIYAGSCLLAICLMIVIVTYVTCFKFIRIPKKAKHSVINISVSILLLCMGFTMGVNRTDQVLACQLVGITIHYFTLCAIFWITITSSNMLKKFTKAEEPPAPPPEPIPMPLPPKPILRFYLLGWGVPIIICGITAAVNLNHYRQSEYCFLSWDPSLGAFYGPVALLVIINLVFFMRISYVIRGAPNNLNYSDEMEELHTNEIELTPNQEFTNIETASLTHTNATSMSSILDTEHRPISQLRALVATLFLYIVVWVCGAFAVARPFRTIIPRQEKIFSYLYGFTSLVLGCFMLGYYCLMRQDSRLSWKRFFSCKQQPAVYNVNVNCETEAPSRVAHTNGHVVRCASSVESSSLTGKVVNIQKEQKQQHNNHNHQHMKNSSRKTSNINLVPSQTASLTEVSFGSIGQDQSYPSFYNPRQNGVAKKFWEKRNHQTKKINKDLGKEINTCSGSYNSNLDNILNDTASKRHSQGTSSDANTHFSIEIQIQANPRNSESNGRVPSGQDEMPPSYDSIRRNKQLPMNIQATHQSAFHAVVPYDRSQMAPGVGGSVVDTCADSVCSSSHYPMSQPESSIPFCSQSTCMNTLGVHTEAPCGCDKYRVQHRSPNRSVTSSPAGSELLQPNISMPRPRDFDGQSQVSQETQGSSLHTRLQPQQLPLLGHPQKHLPAIDQDCCTECLNNVNDNNMLNSQRCMSDSSKQYRTSSDYSSDSNVRKRRQKNFLQELERRIPADEAVNSPVRSDVTQQRHVYAQPNNRRHNHHDSDSQLHYYRSRSNDFSDHNSEPSHRKRHHSHGSARNRNRNRNRHSKQSYGSELQTSSEWDEQFRDRPQKIPYAYVNHRYRERLRQKRLQESGRVGVDPGTKVYWFPKSTSTSAYDEILPGGMEAMAEDTSSSSDNSIDEDIWVLQKERRNRLKKETSV